MIAFVTPTCTCACACVYKSGTLVTTWGVPQSTRKEFYMAVLAGRLGYFILVDMVFITHGLTWNIHDMMSSRPFVTRSLSNRHERVDIACPDNHVMLPPYIAYGASVGGRSSPLRLERDCLGTDPQLVKQSDQCVMNNRCNFSIRKGLRLTTILSGPNKKCLKKFPKYITISLPKCVITDQIHDICSDGLVREYTSGILLGRRQMIPSKNTTETSCHKIMSFLTNVTMSMKLEKFDRDTSYQVIIEWTTQHGTNETRTLRYHHEVFTGIGNHFRISLETLGQNISTPNFYLIYNVRVNTSPNEDLLLDPIPELPTASLRNVMTWKGNQMSFACPKGSLLHSPQLLVGVGDKMTCAGITPGLMMQINNCYWERNCNINWKGPATVTLSDSASCLGKVAAVMSTTGYQCIRQENIINMCSRLAPEKINKASGLIRSHNIYPWDYGAEEVDCRKVTKIGKGRQLLLKIESAQVDESRDTFRIRHINGKKKTIIVDGNIKQFNTTLSGGRVEVSLTVSRRSKTGKGFLLLFEKIGTKNNDSLAQHHTTAMIKDSPKNKKRHIRHRDSKGSKRYRKRKTKTSMKRKPKRSKRRKTKTAGKRKSHRSYRRKTKKSLKRKLNRSKIRKSNK